MAIFGGKKKKPETLVRSKDEPALTNPSGVQTSAPIIERINWLGLKVADVVGETLFFEEKLHLKAVSEGNTAAGHRVIFDCETLLLELSEGGQTWATRPKPRKGSPDVPLIVSFAVDHIEALAQQLNEAEVLTTQVFDQGWVASLLFLDAERNLWQASETRNEPAVKMASLRKIGAVWLGVEDLPGQVAFYRDVLGLPLTDLGNRPRPITEMAEQQQAEEAKVAETEADLPESEAAPEIVTPLPQPVYNAEVGNSEEIGSGATFFDEGARLVLTEGGHKLENGFEKQWGRDTPLMLGFKANNLSGLIEKLREQEVTLQGPFQVARLSNASRQKQAIRFTDPEGNVWQVTE